jgi:NAD(P)-dependent dehydrogenase (short-subunit alcohol dehydrogenase family)
MPLMHSCASEAACDQVSKDENGGCLSRAVHIRLLVTPGEMIHYGMTKTAQLAVSRGLAGLTKGTKVTVNSVLPGPTRSEGILDFLQSLASDPEAPPEKIEAEFFAKGRPSSLLQRMIEPEEIANLVAYVASPLSSATNGAALRVDGGVTPTIG